VKIPNRRKEKTRGGEYKDDCVQQQRCYVLPELADFSKR